MNDLNRNERVLVALGAAMGSNCISCIEYHIPEARRAGLTDSQIAEAIRLGDKVRQVPARKVLDTALRILSETPVSATAEESGPVQTAADASTGGTCCG
jgi:AhpD family alkylhydroperoxidase